MTDHDHLRAAAASLRARAANAQAEVDTMLRRYPEDAQLWTGPAATTFYEVTGDVRRRLDTAAGELRAYADALDTRADELEQGPDGTDGQR